MSLFHGMAAQGMWQEEAGVNLLDSGAPFYDVYRTADDRWLAVACLEPAFYAEWLRLAGIDAARLPAQFDVARWDEIRDAFAAVIATRTRDEWARLVDGSDACVAPVLTMDEAPRHAHLAARGTFVEIDGIVQAAPAPRFSRTAAARPTGVKPPQASALTEWGVDADRVSRLSAAGVIADGVA
jgi:alpha-methylacyl-CoA racemase